MRAGVKGNRMAGQDDIQRAIAFIEANLDRNLAVAEICRHVDCSPFHFHRQFSETTGVSLMRYILQRRLSEAAQTGPRTRRV
jgi:AraC-like DNA-binding protein